MCGPGGVGRASANRADCRDRPGLPVPRCARRRALWSVLRDGRDVVSEVPRSRWDAASLYDPDPDVPGKVATRWGGFLDQVDEFDPEFFGISPRKRWRMDPQQRLLLEVAWEAWRTPARPRSAGGMPHRRLHRHHGRRLRCELIHNIGEPQISTPISPRASRAQRRRRPPLVRARPARPEPRDRHGLLVVAGRRAPGLPGLRVRECRHCARRRA